MAKKDCEACGGTGVIGHEVMQSVPEHHPSCDGNCGTLCPVEVPYLDWEYEQCSCEMPDEGEE